MDSYVDDVHIDDRITSFDIISGIFVFADVGVWFGYHFYCCLIIMIRAITIESGYLITSTTVALQHLQFYLHCTEKVLAYDSWIPTKSEHATWFEANQACR